MYRCVECKTTEKVKEGWTHIPRPSKFPYTYVVKIYNSSLNSVTNNDLDVKLHYFWLVEGGESGSADTARDPRGFAVKMYTEDGNWDIVGNNTPIFFIRDPILVTITWCLPSLSL